MILQSFDFDKALENAKIRASKMVDNGLYSRFKLSLEGRIDKAVLGCLGEIAFEFFLNENQVSYKKDETDFTLINSDEFDFLVKGKKIDIKVAKKTTASSPSDRWTYGYPEEQNPKSKDIVVVGWVDFVNKNVGFYGWTTGERVSTYKVVIVNSFAGYSYLTPNHEFPWGILNKDLSLIL